MDGHLNKQFVGTISLQLRCSMLLWSVMAAGRVVSAVQLFLLLIQAVAPALLVYVLDAATLALLTGWIREGASHSCWSCS